MIEKKLPSKASGPWLAGKLLSGFAAKMGWKKKL
jgi:hypothetical protein